MVPAQSPVAFAHTPQGGVSAQALAANPAAPVLAPRSRGAWPSGFTLLRTPAEILANHDLSDPEQRAWVVAAMSEAEEVRHDAVLAAAADAGIPVRLDQPDGSVWILHDIREEGPLYRRTLNINAAISTGANLIRQVAPYNLSGSGTRAGVWDAGSVRNTHVEFGTNRVVKRNASAQNDDHATHVAGTMGATGVDARAKGMAPLAAIDSYDWNRDYAEMTAAGAATAGEGSLLPVSNHSYGYNAVNADMGRYEQEAVTTDALAYSLPYYLPFWAAGNEQDELTSLGGYQSITFNALAKNVMTVGAVNDAVSGGVRSTGHATMTTFSSWGPCDDGRIKPDVVANGVNVFSTVATSNTAYQQSGWSGTSMASPNAAGSAILLQELHRANFSGQLMRASMLKALLIHTADDLGRPGPDYQFGWGLINVKAAADIILAHKASLASPKLIEGNLTAASKVQTHTFSWDGVSPIRATLSWTDPAGASQTATNSRTRNLRNDLDLKITAPDGTTVWLPYVMPYVGTWTTASMTQNAVTGTNTVDNVERVDLPAPPQAGTYTVHVGMYGTNNFSGSTNQIYSLVVTGGADVPTNPPPSVALTTPVDGTAVLPGVPLELQATATDTVVGGGPGIVAKVEFLANGAVIGEVNTAPYTFVWTPPGSATYQITARATDTEGASATSAAARVTVLTGDGSPAVSSFTPQEGPDGTTVVIEGTNFVGVTSVRFAGVEAASFIVNSAGELSAVVPGDATSGPITVVTGFGTATSTGSFTVVVSPVLISQIYGAGGNSGAVYRSDYIELYNRGSTAVSLDGWSLQYASASGTSWSVAVLSGSIAPGRYHLVQLAGGANGQVLPTPDTVPANSINLSGTQGKVALVNSVTPLAGSSPIGAPGLQDFVGYGTANAAETAPAPAPSTTTAIFRAGDGAIDTGNNAADFTAAAPNPRNAAFGGGAVEGYVVDFEDATKSSYASGNVTLNGIAWNLTETLIGTDASDFKNGLRSARLRGYGTSIITMLADKTGGLGRISLQHRRYGTDEQVEWIVDYSTNGGGSWTEAGRFTPGAEVATFTADINTTQAARIRIRTETPGSSNRRANVDDIELTSFTAASPVISTSGSPAALSAVYGSASAPTTFSVSGANLTTGILVTAPAGFEVSQAPGGESGYATSLTIGSGGSVPATQIHVRLAAGAAAGSRAGQIVCSSAGVAPALVTIPASQVLPKAMTIKADDREKPFGETLTLGPGQTAFSATGLVAGETVGSVTLTASGGLDSTAAAGNYEVQASGATGGTFLAVNYDISYAPGLLTVRGQSYTDWAAGLAAGGPQSDPDRDGLPNLVEYFLGSDASVPGVGPAVGYSPGGVFMDYLRSKNTEGVTGHVTWRADLGGGVGWSAAGVQDVLLEDRGTHELRRATLPLPPEAASRFLRLEVTAP